MTLKKKNCEAKGLSEALFPVYCEQGMHVHSLQLSRTTDNSFVMQLSEEKNIGKVQTNNFTNTFTLT